MYEQLVYTKEVKQKGDAFNCARCSLPCWSEHVTQSRALMSIIQPISFLKCGVQNVMQEAVLQGHQSLASDVISWRKSFCELKYTQKSFKVHSLTSQVFIFVCMIMLFIYIFLQMYCHSYMHSLFQVCCWSRCQGRPNDNPLPLQRHALGKGPVTAGIELPVRYLSFTRTPPRALQRDTTH